MFCILLWNSGIWYGSHRQQNIAAGVENGQVENRPRNKILKSASKQSIAPLGLLEFAQISVGEDGAKNRGEIAEHGEGMVPNGRLIFIVPQNVAQVEREHGLIEKIRIKPLVAIK